MAGSKFSTSLSADADGFLELYSDSLGPNPLSNTVDDDGYILSRK